MYTSARFVLHAAIIAGIFGSSVSFAPSFQSADSRTRQCSANDFCDVAVFGGGFGGLYSALALSREAERKGTKLDIALVDPSDQFVFLPLLYDLTVGTATEAEVCPYYKDILAGTGVRHVKASFEAFPKPELGVATIASGNGTSSSLTFRASVVAVGATPEASLAAVPGALELAQPFYTQKNSEEARELLKNLDKEAKQGSSLRIAIVGGGYGGVELAACVKRRLPGSQVTLLCRSPPMKGTRAELVINEALKNLGVEIEVAGVESLVSIESEPSTTLRNRKVVIQKSFCASEDEQSWDAVFWTAGSGPASPVSNNLKGLVQTASGCLVVDSSLQCRWEDEIDLKYRYQKPPVWALGDCSQVEGMRKEPAVPKTAQAAMQQADVIAFNLLAYLQDSTRRRYFRFQDLGSVLTLGGPNAAAFAPRDDSPFGPIFAPLLDTARASLLLADEVGARLLKSSAVETTGVSQIVEGLGLSLGGHGLAMDNSAAPGTLTGSVAGLMRRALYAARMPTNRQRVTSAASAVISTASALATEASDRIEKKDKDGP